MMSTTAAPDRFRYWMDTGTALFTASVNRLTDADLSAKTCLPGWSRRHVIAHLGFNAEALRRLVRWASTGDPIPMYASPEQRAREIEDAVTWPAHRLRRFVTDTAAQLSGDLDGLPDDRWTAEVITAQGRTVAATEIPWLRTREVAVHAVDLGAGADFEDLPEELCAALVTDIARLRSARGGDAALKLRSGDQAWSVSGAGTPTQVSGSPAVLARWLTGRGTAGITIVNHQTMPVLSPWL
jgi:maleylpyruvate isomerase